MMSYAAQNFRLGIDLMGADVPPQHILEAATSFPQDFYSDLALTFFGREEVLHLLQQFGKKIPSITLRVCPDVVQMNDDPLQVIREKKESSLAVGIQTLKMGQIDAFLSCANTGALVACARSAIDTLSSITRPALATEFPTQNGSIVLLDIGGNVESSIQTYVQFAFLGAGYARSVQGILRPKVALLNIGEESLKGTQELKKTWQMLHAQAGKAFEFVGNKEPQDVIQRAADVFVTNGFVGNLFVKTAEAMQAFLLDRLQQKFPEILAQEMPSDGHGAVLLGCKELVVKCHGAPTRSSVQEAICQVKKLFMCQATTCIEHFLAQHRREL